MDKQSQTQLSIEQNKSTKQQQNTEPIPVWIESGETGMMAAGEKGGSPTGRNQQDSGNRYICGRKLKRRERATATTRQFFGCCPQQTNNSRRPPTITILSALLLFGFGYTQCADEERTHRRVGRGRQGGRGLAKCNSRWGWINANNSSSSGSSGNSNSSSSISIGDPSI